MKIPRPTTVDFEGFGIEARPDYPPVPVSVSIKRWGKAPKFYAWGHPTGNNCTKAAAIGALREAYLNPDGILCQNGKFDIDVAEVHFGVKPPPWERIHETMFLLFLDDPHQRQMGLKKSCQRLLGMAPDERDAVAEWLVENQPVPGIRITASTSPQAKHPFGKYIAYAPGNVVGPYANGDTVRTEALFAKLYPSIVEKGMLPAYDRERRLVPTLLGMERAGTRVDLPRLRSDVTLYRGVMGRLDAWLVKRLKCDPMTNFGSGQQLLGALMDAGIADLAAMGITKKGNVKTDKAALAVGVSDKVVSAVLKYRTQLSTCLSTFMEPWLETAERSGGFIFTNWRQTSGGEGYGGTRTGRFSSSPNFQNMPKEFEAIFYDAENKTLPKCPLKDLPALPLCRGYIIPYQKGHVLLSRDYSQQEPRILAHFEDGALQQQYQDSPWIDYHDNAKEHLERIFKRVFKRKPVKNINLGIIYGQGVPSLALKNNESIADTTMLRNAIYKLYPGLKDMNDDMRKRARTNQPICTWGGRIYYCEPPRFIDKKFKTFDYKMVNVLVQGSAADCTKEAMIRFMEKAVHRYHNRGWKLLLQVHDEIVLSVPAEDLMEASELLREAMESVEFDVRMLSEGSWSNDNWAAMIDLDKKGKRLPGAIPKQRKAA